MCDWVTLLYSRKLTELYKPAIMEKKIIKISFKKSNKRRVQFLPRSQYLLGFIYCWRKGSTSERDN